MKKLIAILLIILSIVALSSCLGGVEFELNFVVDGEIYDTVTTKGKEIVKIPNNPAKEGYTFDGWYWDKDEWQKPFTANSLLDAPISSNMSVYAKWKENAQAHAHNPSDWIEDIAATCKAEGSKHKECTDCEEVLETGTIEKTNKHTPAEAVVENFVDSDCENEGSYNSVVYCSVCEIKLSSEAKTVEKKKHTPSDWIIDTEATCKVAGSKHKECTECEKVLETDKIEKLTTHTYTNDSDVDCNVCGEKREIACMHVNTTVVEGKNASCTESGLTDGLICDDCKSVITAQAVIPASHKEIIIPEIEPECNNCGWTEGKQCELCYEFVVEPQPIKQLGHQCGEWIVGSEPTDNEPGEKYRICTRCDEVVEIEIIPALVAKPLYTRDGDYIYFGEYPQSIKTDDVTITGEFDERGYVLGSDGCYYAKVIVAWADKSSGKGYKFSNGELINNEAIYYFKVEPIRWRILSETNGVATIMCDSIIDNIMFGTEKNKNNYALSEVRKWLNETFYETAFNELQREIIAITTVDNSANSTGYAQNPYVCQNTNDKIFLLSYKDALNEKYGFETIAPFSDENKALITSDYSRAFGAYMSTNSTNYGCGLWVLRSPEANKFGTTPFNVYAVNGNGEVSGGNMCSDSYGIVPVLTINL